jgi:hypothetical protein
MIVIGILACFAGLASLCWFLFELAVYALPAATGIAAGVAASRSGAGVAGAIVVGLGTAFALVAVWQLIAGLARSRWTVFVFRLAFAAPAALAGYEAVHGIAALTTPAEGWRQAFAIVGAVVVGVTAWARISTSSQEAAALRARIGGSISPPDTTTRNT